MNITPFSEKITRADVDVVVVGVYADRPLPGPAAEVDKAADGLIARLIAAHEISTERCETATLFAVSGVRAPLVLVVGLGKEGAMDRQVAFRAAGAAARCLAGKERGRVAFFLDHGWRSEWVEAAVAGAIVGCQGQDLYRAEKKRHPFGEQLWATGHDDAVRQGGILGESTNLARRLVNEPPDALYPESFAEQAETVAAESGLEVEVWDEARLADERAGALLAVARGSARPPRLVIVRHRGAADDAPQLALVGKGVTFDSGGLSLKPSDSMLAMKCDMAGAATVLAAMQAIGRLKLPVNVVGLMGLVENMPDGRAMKLGDVLRARNGRTIEVHNTDAEGRLVLADVLSVAVDQGAAKLIDLATLTGACVVALGMDVAGLMSNNQAWCDSVAAAARDAGEPVWQLPMYDEEFGEQIKCEVADIKNVGEGRWGGAITAAKFLEEFVAETPWTHIDIAGPAFLEKPKPWQDAGGSGALVRALVEVARRWA